MGVNEAEARGIEQRNVEAEKLYMQQSAGKHACMMERPPASAPNAFHLVKAR